MSARGEQAASSRPGGYTIRPPTFGDAERVLALMIACDIAEFGEPQGITLAEPRDTWR